jgi:hypothetical protein
MEPFQGLSERVKGFLTTGESKKIGMNPVAELAKRVRNGKEMRELVSTVDPDVTAGAK